MARGGKGGGTQTVTTAPDPKTQARIDTLFGAANAAGNAPGTPVDPRVLQAADQYSRMMGAGNQGLLALGGDSAATSALMNPYSSQVMDRFNAETGVAQGQALKAVADQATAQGAFGNTRQGLAEGQALGDINRAALDQKANLLYSGFNDAMGRAGQLANLGMGATGALADSGKYIRDITASNDPAARRYQALLSAMQVTPGGTTTTQPLNGNAGGSFLGGAAQGLGLIGKVFGTSNPWALGAGAIGGGLLNLF